MWAAPYFVESVSPLAPLDPPRYVQEHPKGPSGRDHARPVLESGPDRVRRADGLLYGGEHRPPSLEPRGHRSSDKILRVSVMVWTAV